MEELPQYLDRDCQKVFGADYRQPSSTDEGICRDAVQAAGVDGVERGISYQRAARALLIEGHARHLPFWRAHPLWRRLGQVVVEVYRYYRAAFRCSSASISGAGKQLQSTQSVRFFGGISSGIMLGLLATWRCLLLDIVQTGVTSWLAPVRARCGSPMSHYLFLGQDRSYTTHTPVNGPARILRCVAGPRSGTASPGSGPECVEPLAPRVHWFGQP